MKKRSRFSIFFRGCNQHKFIHITGTNVQTFLRHRSLYLKILIKKCGLIPEIHFPGFVAALSKKVGQVDYLQQT